MRKVNVLFVCTGNICRSPTAEGLFAHLVRERGHADYIGVDSAGILDEHVGEPPDPRTLRTALKHGFDFSHLRARQVRREDFERFHYIIGMDRDHLRLLRTVQPSKHGARLRLFCEFAPNREEGEVIDPYYGNQKDFDHVFNLCREAAEGLLAAVLAEHFPNHVARTD